MQSKFNHMLAAVGAVIFLSAPVCSSGQLKNKSGISDWKMQPAQIQSRWAKEVSSANALKEYPRPQMIRTNWTNLNGLWEYAVTTKDSARPEKFDGKILVPYPLESVLSGVKKSLMPDQYLWYKRNVNFTSKPGERTLLNFGAVDYRATVFVNGKEVGEHSGGYTEFSFDITSALVSGNNELVVKVYDPTNTGFQPHGKQVLNPANIYYTPTSGIWQTVWMETVPVSHINGLVITPDIDQGIVNVVVKADGSLPVSLTVEGKVIKGESNKNIAVKIANPKLWSPSSPYLYDLKVAMGKDEVKSYFGMRKISVAKDQAGVERIMLNNKPYYNLGTLDQGFWPEGLYTAPTDEALAYDIKAIKAMGFNTIRKHIKVEPARWYYHADKLGMLVWQDMVNPNQKQPVPVEAQNAFEDQCKETLAQLHNYPSIVTWVLFNEKWGQYDQARLTSWIKSVDPSRIVNGHSGEYLYVNDKLRSPSPDAYVNADMTDVHSYPQPMDAIKMDSKARVCGEFGGIGVFIPNHQWSTDAAWGYVQEKPADLKAKYARMCDSLLVLQKQGLSGSIYTQPFDVEIEQNGLMTYDREIAKIPFAELRKIHSKLNPDAEKNVPVVTAKDADLTDPAVLAERAIAAFKSGNRDNKTLQAIVRSVSKVSDPGFELMTQNPAVFRTAMGSVAYSSMTLNMLLKEEMYPMFAQKKSWEEIGERLKKYGEAGEESYLRIKSIGLKNEQKWPEFKTTAKLYLEKYGKNMTEQDKAAFQKAIADN